MYFSCLKPEGKWKLLVNISIDLHLVIRLKFHADLIKGYNFKLELVLNVIVLATVNKTNHFIACVSYV